MTALLEYLDLFIPVFLLSRVLSGDARMHGVALASLILSALSASNRSNASLLGEVSNSAHDRAGGSFTDKILRRNFEIYLPNF